jgi:tRNA(Leu) C34 or U34 (ribose-2'-O)-methylase TrmL
MARITRDGFEACMAFGAAALAVADVAAQVADRPMDRAACDLFDELEVAHHRLRALFDLGEDKSVHALALSVLVLAERTTRANQEHRGLTDS